MFIEEKIKGAVAELSKNFWERLEMWNILAILGVLLDEMLKEGYFFKATDLLSPALTHEKILAMLVVFALALGWKNGNSIRPEATH